MSEGDFADMYDTKKLALIDGGMSHHAQSWVARTPIGGSGK